MHTKQLHLVIQQKYMHTCNQTHRGTYRYRHKQVPLFKPSVPSDNVLNGRRPVGVSPLSWRTLSLSLLQNNTCTNDYSNIMHTGCLCVHSTTLSALKLQSKADLEQTFLELELSCRVNSYEQTVCSSYKHMDCWFLQTQSRTLP